MVSPNTVYMHVTSELTSYWLACFYYICSNVEFGCSGTYICAGIFGQSMYTSVCFDIVHCIEYEGHILT